jgi:hypothetical protein
LPLVASRPLEDDIAVDRGTVLPCLYRDGEQAEERADGQCPTAPRIVGATSDM